MLYSVEMRMVLKEKDCVSFFFFDPFPKTKYGMVNTKA